MIRRLNIHDPKIARKVLGVQIPSYQIEAELISFDGIPQLYDTVEKLMQCEEIFDGYFIGESLAGAISYVKRDNELDIHRLVVHPKFFRQGVGISLVSHVIAQNLDVERVIVRTGARNEPAKNLYRKSGFMESDHIEVEPAVLIVVMEKRRQGQ